MASVAKLMQAIKAANMQDQITFVMSNVFGRTMVSGQNADGRQHNPGHNVTVMIGPGVKGSVIGGPVLTPGGQNGGEYASPPIDSSTGQASSLGDIAFGDTLNSMGKTVAAAVGIEASVISQNIVSGSIVGPALAS